MKNILPFMTSVIVTLAATEIPSYISYEVFLAYIGMGLSDMSLGRLIYGAEGAMLTPDGDSSSGARLLSLQSSP